MVGSQKGTTFTRLLKLVRLMRVGRVENLRSLGPASEILAAQTLRLSGEQALGIVITDKDCLFEDYDLMSGFQKNLNPLAPKPFMVVN